MMGSVHRGWTGRGRAWAARAAWMLLAVAALAPLPAAAQRQDFALMRSEIVNAGDGSFRFYVGGTLHVNPNQAPGRYNGTFQIRVDYN